MELVTFVKIGTWKETSYSFAPLERNLTKFEMELLTPLRGTHVENVGKSGKGWWDETKTMAPILKSRASILRYFHCALPTNLIILSKKVWKESSSFVGVWQSHMEHYFFEILPLFTAVALEREGEVGGGQSEIPPFVEQQK